MPYTTNFMPTASALVGFQPINETATTAQHSLGVIFQAVDRGANSNGAGEFIYLRGVTGTVAGSVVTYNSDDYSTALLTTGQFGPVAVAMSANVANQFGWYQIQGKAVANAVSGFADNGLVYASATPGSVTNAVTAGSRVKGALGGSAVDFPATGKAEVELSRPAMDNGAAS